MVYSCAGRRHERCVVPAETRRVVCANLAEWGDDTVNSGYSYKPQSASVTLFITFLLGIGIGFTLCYALFESLGTDFSGDLKYEVPPQAARPALSEGPAPAKPEDPAPKEDAAASEGSALLDVLRPARHLFITLEGAELTEEVRVALSSLKPGGIILREGNLSSRDQAASLSAELRGLFENPADRPFICVAQEGGAQNPLGLDYAPSAEELGQRADTPAAKELGRAYAAAARRRGIEVVLAPVLDVAGSNTPPEYSARSFGASPEGVTQYGLALAEGLGEGGVLAFAKHYPGIGGAVPRDGMPTLPQTEVRDLAELMFPFAEAATQGLAGLVVGHVAVPGLDQEHPKRSAALSPVLVRQILREKWEYEGVVLAADVTHDPMTAGQPRGVAVVAALVAGCDAVVLYDTSIEDLEAVCDAIVQAVREEALLADQLAMSKARLAACRARIEPFEEEPPSSIPDKPAPIPEENAVPEQTPAGREDSATPPEPEPAESSEEAEQPDTPVEDPPESSGDQGEPAVDTEDTPEAPSVEEPLVDMPSEADGEVRMPAKETGQEPVPQPPNTKATVHRIRRGENLVGIGQEYGVSVADLKAWNALDTSKIKYGFPLKVYIPQAEEEPKTVEPAPGVEEAAQSAQESSSATNETPSEESPAEEVPGAVPAIDALEDSVPKPEGPAAEPSEQSGVPEVSTETAPPETTEPAGAAEEPPEQDETVEAAEDIADEAAPETAEPAPPTEVKPEQEETTVAEDKGEETAPEAAEPGSVPEEQPGQDETPETEVAAEDNAGEATPEAPATPEETTEVTVEEAAEETTNALPSPLEDTTEEPALEVTKESEPSSDSINELQTGETGDAVEVAGEESQETESAVSAEPASSLDRVEIYVVKRGDTLRRIAGQFNTTQQKILDLNNMTNPNLVMLGQRLKVPAPAAEAL